jgi:NAD-dependent dihydropyrimidine dehydrogenase PreA subunit
MKEKNIPVQGESVSPSPLTFDAKLCNGCNLCVEVCQVDILIPNPEKGCPPNVLYPGECWYGGSCVDICPIPGAIKLHTPKMNQVDWKPK